MRLQKYIAASGLCSRREAEERIRAGRVTLNGAVAALGDCTESEQDVICVDGRPVRAVTEHTYVLLHKPRGYITTLHDEKGRPTVATLTESTGKRLFPVGRLDCMSEGLLLMTDDGEVANRLAHPSHGVKKTYRVTVDGTDIEMNAKKLRHSITYEGVTYRGAEVRLLRLTESGAVLELTVSDGKNHEVRNMCASVGFHVRRLIRIRQGELTLGTLPAGEWRYLTEEERKFLQNLQ